MKGHVKKGIIPWAMLFAALAYLAYFLQEADSTLFYFWQQAIPLSLGESLTGPGGFAAYLAGHLLEGLHRPVSGNIVCILILGTVWTSLGLLLRPYRMNWFYQSILLACLIPVALLFTHYRLPFQLLISTSLGLLLAMLFNLHVPRRAPSRILYMYLAAGVIYLATGVTGLVLWFQVVLLGKLSRGHFAERLASVGILLLPLLYLPFDTSLTIKLAYLDPFTLSATNELPAEFYLALLSPALLQGIMAGFEYFSRGFRKVSRLPVSIASSLLVLVLLILTTQVSLEEKERDAYTILRAGFNEDWPEVIRLSRQLNAVNNLIQFEANRALYHSGLLLEDLFNYPQAFAEKGLFLDGIFSSHVAVHTAAFYHDLRFANETRHWSTEAQMVLVRHPQVLKYLVVSHLATGTREAALKYLRILSGSRIYRDWAEDVLKMVEEHREAEHPVIKAFMENDPGSDFFAGVHDPVAKMKSFHFFNRGNRMAFEYLVAGYLLQHRLDAVVALLPVFRELGYEKLPENVEEALIIYQAKTGLQVDAAGYPIREESLNRFYDFSQQMGRGKTRAEREKLCYNYRNTYWYYIVLSSPYANKN